MLFRIFLVVVILRATPITRTKVASTFTLKNGQVVRYCERPDPCYRVDYDLTPIKGVIDTADIAMIKED